MKPPAAYLFGSVLPTVVVVSVVLLTAMLGLVALWEQQTLLFARGQRLRQARAVFGSAYTLYSLHPDEQALKSPDGYLLYDSLPQSRISVRTEPWGLYEAVHCTTSDSLVAACRLFGVQPAVEQTLYYADNRAAVTLAGQTRLQGTLRLPQNGLVYGRMGSDFYCGEEIPRTAIRHSAAALPAYAPAAAACPGFLLTAARRLPQCDELPDSLCVSFRRDSTAVVCVGSAEIAHCVLRGRILLAAEELRIDSTCRMEHLLIAARKIVVGAGTRITAQLFARDTIVVEQRAVLEYPSGIYAGAYAELCARAEVNGYVIVRDTVQRKKLSAAYRQARTARLRGLLLIEGAAQVQGIVAGEAVLTQAVYFSPQGYYKELLYDFTLLENPVTAQPLWRAGADTLRRKEAACVE